MLVILIQRPKIKDLMLYDVTVLLLSKENLAQKKEWGNHFICWKTF